MSGHTRPGSQMSGHARTGPQCLAVLAQSVFRLGESETPPSIAGSGPMLDLPWRLSTHCWASPLYSWPASHVVAQHSFTKRGPQIERTLPTICAGPRFNTSAAKLARLFNGQGSFGGVFDTLSSGPIGTMATISMALSMARSRFVAVWLLTAATRINHQQTRRCCRMHHESCYISNCLQIQCVYGFVEAGMVGTAAVGAWTVATTDGIAWCATLS